MKLSNKILIPATIITALGLVILTLIISLFTYNMTDKIINETGQLTASKYALLIQEEINLKMNTIRVSGKIFEQINSLALSERRDFINKTLKKITSVNEDILGSWTVWEPDYLEGNDRFYKNTPGADTSGRFVPYWNRVGGLHVEACMGYENDDEIGQYYHLAKKTGNEVIMEPVTYPINNENVTVVSLCVPIIIDNRVCGVAGVDFSMDDFKKLVSTVKPYETGYGFLYSNKGSIIAHPDNTKIGKFLNDVNPELERKFRISDKISSGEYYKYSEKVSVNNTSLIILGAPLIIGDTETPWSFGIAIPVKVAYLGLSNLIKIIIALSSGITILLFISLFLITKTITGPLITIDRKVEEISTGKGDLTAIINIPSNDEISHLGMNFNKFTSTLRIMISKIKEIGEVTNGISGELSSSTEETSASLDEIRTNIESIKDKIVILDKEVEKSDILYKEITDNYKKLTNLIVLQSSDITESSSSIEQISSSIRNIADTVENKYKTTIELQSIAKNGELTMNETIEIIKKVASSASIMMNLLTVINDIASQTDLLAMNAAIEAAHAGESGKGFSVVADEIRKLAENTAVNSKQISVSLNDVVSNISISENATIKTGEFFRSITAGIDDVSGNMLEIKNATNELDSGARQIIVALSSLITINADVSTTSEEIKNKVDSLSKSISGLSFISTETKNGIEEISIGINEIYQAVSDITESSLKNSDNIKTIQHLLSDFKT